jgi:hypothetical protein
LRDLERMQKAAMRAAKEPAARNEPTAPQTLVAQGIAPREPVSAAPPVFRPGSDAPVKMDAQPATEADHPPS